MGPSPNTSEPADRTEKARGGNDRVPRALAVASRTGQGEQRPQATITAPSLAGPQFSTAELTGIIHSGGTNALAPNRMSARERLEEISELLATAILRRRVREGRH